MRTRSPIRTHANTAAASGLSAKITSTIATLVRVRATTIPIDEAENAAATANPGLPIFMTARSVPRRSRHTIHSEMLTLADNARQKTVVHACE